MTQITSEIRAIVIKIEAELELSLRRKFEAFALMMKRLISQTGKENDLPLRIKSWAFDERRATMRARIKGTNMTIKTGSKTSQNEIRMFAPSKKGKINGMITALERLVTNTAATTYSISP